MAEIEVRGAASLKESASCPGSVSA